VDWLAGEKCSALLSLLRPALLFALPQVVELMAAEKGWSRWRSKKELQRALDFLQTFDAPHAQAPPAPAAAS